MHFHSCCISVKFTMNSICHLRGLNLFGVEEGEPSNKQTFCSTSGGPYSHSNWEVKQEEVYIQESGSCCYVHVTSEPLKLIMAIHNTLPSCFLSCSCSMCWLLTCANMRKHTPFRTDLGNVVVYEILDFSVRGLAQIQRQWSAHIWSCPAERVAMLIHCYPLL